MRSVSLKVAEQRRDAQLGGVVVLVKRRPGAIAIAGHGNHGPGGMTRLAPSLPLKLSRQQNRGLLQLGDLLSQLKVHRRQGVRRAQPPERRIQVETTRQTAKTSQASKTSKISQASKASQAAETA
jgi:hypothetical protein|tara:strand:- start:2599 stop:2973 length:375 start_codon:yes stop_codon:yes gene_type:complete